MYEEPFPHIVYLAVKERMEEGSTQAQLAEAYADVTAKCSAFHHELDDPDYVRVYDKVSESSAMWEELEEDLYDRIVGILKAENESHNAGYVLSGIGRHYIVKPFMERNGFRDGNGWWIKE